MFAGEVSPRGRNMNVILAVNQEIGLVHHQLGQFTIALKTFIKNELARQEIQAELVDDNEKKRAAGLNKQQWRYNILLDSVKTVLGK